MGQQASSTTTSATAAATGNEIAEADKKWCEAMAENNSEGLNDLYTEDAKIMNCPGCQPECGRDELSKLLKWFADNGCTAAKLSAKEIQPGLAAKERDTVWDREKYVFLNDATVKFNGNKVVVWKREHGELKIHIDCWNPLNNIN